MELKKLVNGAKIKFKDEVNIFSKTNNWQLLGSVIHSLIKEEYSARCIGLILQEINNNSNLEAKGIVELIKKRIENIKTLRIAKPSY
jgi:hypothetical protein